MYSPPTGVIPQADIPKDLGPLVRGPNSWHRGLAFGGALVLVTGLMVGTMGAPAQAAAGPTVISLTFDDTNAEQASVAATMNGLGLKGTFYVNSGWIGQPGYMTAAQLTQMQAAGNEIGGHTINHPDLTTLPADEAKREICNDRAALTGRGYKITSFAYPFAAVNAATEAIVKGCGYNSARGLGDLTSATDTDPGSAGEPWAGNIPPQDPYLLAAPVQVSSTWTLPALQKSVTQAQLTGGWVPLTFHHILDSTAPGYDPTLSISPAVFKDFVTWLKAQQDAGKVTVKTVNQVIGGTVKPTVPGPALPPPPPPGTNMIDNPGMETLVNGTPLCWSGTGFGNNTVNYSVVSPGHSGNNAGHAVMVKYTDGDGKFLQSMDSGTCSPAGTPGHTYKLSAWYTSTVQTQFEVYFRTAAGAWDYWTASPKYAASSAWTQVTWTTPALPAGATGISWGLNIFSVGTITTDDYSMIDVTNLNPSLVSRIGGADRYAVSAAVSKATFAPGVGIAYVAGGAVFPDALSGAAAAGKTGSPVLLAPTNGITADVAAELARLKPQKIVVLGGTGTLTDNVFNALKKYSPVVTRIGGADRYAVSAAVSKSAFAPGIGIAYVASGAVFPDALSGAAAAAKTGSPVILAAPNGLTDTVKAELQRLKPKKIIILGGTGSVSSSIQDQLGAYVG